MLYQEVPPLFADYHVIWLHDIGDLCDFFLLHVAITFDFTTSSKLCGPILVPSKLHRLLVDFNYLPTLIAMFVVVKSNWKHQLGSTQLQGIVRKAGIFKGVLNKLTILEKYHNRKVVSHHAKIASMWVKAQKRFPVLSSKRSLKVKTLKFYHQSSSLLFSWEAW